MESNTNKDEKKMSKEDLEKKMHKLEVSKKELSQKLIEKKISALDYEIEQVKQGISNQNLYHYYLFLSCLIT